MMYPSSAEPVLPMTPLRVSLLLLLFLFAGPEAARAADPFESFIVGLRSTCARAPAMSCTTAVSRFLDSDRNGKVEPHELDAASRMATAAIGKSDGPLNATERSSVAVALMILKSAGTPQVIAGFDSNGDGGISNTEMFQDFRIDRRPFGAIVRDRKSVDWSALSQRFGKVGGLLKGLEPPPSK
ncbi:MAG: hypothetical protein AB7P12_07225 [Alphaproteobacteria bacterium]